MGIADVLPGIGHHKGELKVRLSNQIIHLLSEQMYSSPLKAIEELVVNSYDADAEECRIGIPPDAGPDRFIVVFDDGSGMDYQGLAQLWHVGESPKKETDRTPIHHRKLIGKFGIGKLATYAIADKITYLTRKGGRVYHVICDYRAFKSNPEGASDPVPLNVNEVDDPKVFRSEEVFKSICDSVGVIPADLTNGVKPTWTFCVLENLKPKAADLKLGRLKWVLRTAMPLKSDFSLWVNKEKVESAKSDYKTIVKFTLGELPNGRIQALNGKMKDPTWHWKADGDGLVSEAFPSGVRGEVIVTDRSLVQGKSADMERSHGFFVKVRERLVAEKDELFGLHALTHQTFNFFRADVRADDLNSEITAPREGLEIGARSRALSAVLLEAFNEARSRHEAEIKRREDAEKRKREHEREYVPTHLVEHAIADTLSVFGGDPVGSDADDTWFFMTPQLPKDLTEIVEKLYTERRKFRYNYVGYGKSDRLVKFDPGLATFSLNQDHEVVVAYADDPRSRALLEDVATSEVLLEVYMREARVDPYVIGDILERRDMLMRSLSQDRVYSLDAIAQSLRDSVNDEHNLEVSLVAAARALGFNAKHISKAGEPDGLARFNNLKSGETKITLEAKSSQDVPNLGALDFAGLAQHVAKHAAQGCLLVAPAYPGEAKKKKSEGGDVLDSAAEGRAVDARISCWTIEDLARIVAAAETHQITASEVLDITLTKFRPSEVHAAVEKLLTRTNMQLTYREILTALRRLNSIPQPSRAVQHVSAVLATTAGIKALKDEEVKSALVDMANVSRGILRVSGDAIFLNGDLDELERRVATLTGSPGQPRRAGTFRTEGAEGKS
jgi:hypothetical protein